MTKTLTNKHFKIIGEQIAAGKLTKAQYTNMTIPELKAYVVYVQFETRLLENK